MFLKISKFLVSMKQNNYSILKKEEVDFNESKNSQFNKRPATNIKKSRSGIELRFGCLRNIGSVSQYCQVIITAVTLIKTYL